MNYIIVAVASAIAAFIGGVLVGRRNPKKANAVVTAVTTEAKKL